MAVAAQASGTRVRGRSRGSTRAGRRAIGRGWVIATYVALVVFVLWTVIPFVWMILASIKTNKEIYDDCTLLRKTVYFGHYVSLLAGKIGIWVRSCDEGAIASTG